MHLAPIPTFSNYFSLVLGARLAQVTGFSLNNLSSPIYSKSSSLYLIPVFTHFHVQQSLS